MNLLIVESPAKAKTIEKYLGKDFKVISSYGHIRGIPSIKGAVEPDNNFHTRYAIGEKAIKHVEQIVKAVKDSDLIYLATDPDREGEAISWHIFEVIKSKKAIKNTTKVKRVIFHEITKKAVLNAIDTSREINMDLVHAQQARQALDYLVGFTISPILWRKLPGSKSAGRVQSVALRIICDRENEIEKFKQQEYWTIDAEFAKLNNTTFRAQLFKIEGENLEKFAFTNQKSAQDIVTLLPKEGYEVSNIKSKQLKRIPPPPFTTSSMLQEASRKLGFSAKKTASIAQRLYEGIQIGKEILGLITYMRTDSVTVSKDAILETIDVLKNSYGNKYLPSKPRVYKSKIKNAQEAHEAIRPTSVKRKPEDITKYLDNDQLKLYTLIWKRMMASQMSDAVIHSLVIEITTEEKKFIFKATGSSIIFDGFYKLYKEGIDDETKDDRQKLPKLSEKEKLNLKGMLPNQHFTQPPPRYTEASLVKKMEELGIGRPSTYPIIMTILVNREYSKLDKKRFIPEARGRLVNAFLTEFFEKYVEYDFTAKLEDDLDYIATGKKNWKHILSDFWLPFKTLTDKIMTLKTIDILHKVEKSLTDFIFSRNNATDINTSDKHICPECKEGILGLRNSKFGSFIGCSKYPDCNYKRPIGNNSETKESNALHNKIKPQSIGIDSTSGKEIFLKKGPYGFYLEIEKEKKRKRVSIPKNIEIADINLKIAQKLINLPLLIGKHPKTSHDIFLKIGKYGPYLECNKKFYSIKNSNFLETNLEDALLIMNTSKKKETKKK